MCLWGGWARVAILGSDQILVTTYALTLAIARFMRKESEERSQWELLSEDLDGRRTFGLVIDVYLQA